MRTRAKLKPGQRGTLKLLAQYGKQLVCVRYRYDEERHKRFTTVELIVSESEWHRKTARIAPDAHVGVRVGYAEKQLQHKIKQMGGAWNAARRLWEMRYDSAVALGLEERIVQ